MTTGQAIVKSLRAHDIDTVFGLPGIQLDYLFNAFHDEGNSLRIVHPRHEQAAVTWRLATRKRPVGLVYLR